MKSYNSGLSGLVCSKERRAACLPSTSGPRDPALVEGFPEGRTHVEFCRTHNNTSSGLLRGTAGRTLAYLQDTAVQSTRLFLASFSHPGSAPKPQGLHPYPGSEITGDE